jgi:hypothetical protein
MLSPPDDKFKEVRILGVTDSDEDPVSIVIDSIFQDEKVRSKKRGLVDGKGVGTSAASLRAKRDGKGNGRVYRISFTADDGQGGSCSDYVKVNVPHDMGKKSIAVDNGPIYDSTVPSFNSKEKNSKEKMIEILNHSRMR